MLLSAENVCLYCQCSLHLQTKRRGGKHPEIGELQFLEKAFLSLFISTKTGVLPALLTHNAPPCNIKMPRRIKAQLRIKIVILRLERTAGREKLFVATPEDLPQKWVSLGASITADFFKQPSRCNKRFKLPNKLYPDTLQSTSFYKPLS